MPGSPAPSRLARCTPPTLRRPGSVASRWPALTTHASHGAAAYCGLRRDLATPYLVVTCDGFGDQSPGGARASRGRAKVGTWWVLPSTGDRVRELAAVHADITGLPAWRVR